MSLDEYVQSGSQMEAKVSADLLATIFTPYSPLHDGAVIIRGDTIIGAGCILPLSQAALADRSLGTRHRAALGLERGDGRAGRRRLRGDGDRSPSRRTDDCGATSRRCRSRALVSGRAAP